MSLAFGLLILRLVVGLTLAAHGAQKLFGWWGGPGMAGWTQVVRRLRIRPAKPWAWVAALSEFGGGLLVASGFLTPLGCLATARSRVLAIATVRLSEGLWATEGGDEFNLSILAAVATLALAGPGAYSLDEALRIHFPQPA